jgi:hypothetical protein
MMNLCFVRGADLNYPIHSRKMSLKAAQIADEKSLTQLLCFAINAARGYPGMLHLRPDRYDLNRVRLEKRVLNAGLWLMTGDTIVKRAGRTSRVSVMTDIRKGP